MVALMGRTLSEVQKSSLISSVGHLILMLDGDDAGRQAQDEMLPILARHFFVKSVSLPAGEQPDTVDEGLLYQLLKTKTQEDY